MNNANSDNDEALVRQANAGGKPALIALLERHGPAVRGGVTSHIPRQWQAILSTDDIMQEAYTDAFLGISRFEYRGDGSFPAWLTTLAKRTLLDAVRMLEAEKRGGGRRQINTHPRDKNQSFAALIETISGHSSTPSRKASGREAVASLHQAIEQLPTVYRQVVQMYDLENRSIEDVATAIKRSTGAAFMQRLRAHRMLAELMGSAGNFFSQTA